MKSHRWGMERIECQHILTLPRGDKMIVSERPLAKVTHIKADLSLNTLNHGNIILYFFNI